MVTNLVITVRWVGLAYASMYWAFNSGLTHLLLGTYRLRKMYPFPYALYERIVL